MKDAAFCVTIAVLVIAPTWIFAQRIDSDEIMKTLIGFAAAGIAGAFKVLSERLNKD